MIDFDPETALAIASSTNPASAPIVLTTSTNHGLSAGDFFFVKGHDNVLANGKQAAASVTANTLTLGVNGNGGAAGTNVGNVIPYTNGGIGIPEDGELADASAGGSGATVTSMIAALADRVGYLKNATVLDVVTVSAVGTTTMVATSGATFALLKGAGNAGSGGGGAGGGLAINRASTGGGAGAGTEEETILVPILGGETYAVDIPAASTGGAGGAAATNGSPGVIGGDVTFGISGGATLATFPGGGAGAAGFYDATSGDAVCSVGGMPTKSGVLLTGSSATSPSIIGLAAAILSRCPGEGGYSSTTTSGITSGHGADGVRSTTGNDGGSGGTSGTGATGPYNGGAGGGGGGGGAYGVGGAGGSGGAGSTGAAGSSSAGTAGSNGGTCAGGGGGGAGGTCNSGTLNVGAAGGDGGTGQVTVMFLGGAS